MVTIQPFRALRYDPARVGALSAVLAPPYDVINAVQQEQLYQASPYNVIRLILGKEYPNDTPQENRYTRTQRDFAAWRQNGVLQQDATPALYLIQHTFSGAGGSVSRWGFIALLQFESEATPNVFRHEMTLSAPKVDRTKLLAAVPANLEPIFCIYPDPGAKVQGLLAATAEVQKPTGEATVGAEEAVRLWALTDPGVVQHVVAHLKRVAVLIADGHHRFEVAQANRAQYPAVMTYFASMEDPALVVRPIHRMLTHAAPLETGLLQRWCTLTPLADMPAALAWLEANKEPGCFGVFDGRRWVGVALLGGCLRQWLSDTQVPNALATLDVILLHQLLLPGLDIRLDAAAAAGPSGATVRYFADPQEAVQTLGAATGSVWLLRGIPLPQVYDIASQGYTLPQKSTYFYPKVPSGLVMNLHSA